MTMNEQRQNNQRLKALTQNSRESIPPKGSSALEKDLLPARNKTNTLVKRLLPNYMLCSLV